MIAYVLKNNENYIKEYDYDGTSVVEEDPKIYNATIYPNIKNAEIMGNIILDGEEVEIFIQKLENLKIQKIEIKEI